MRFYLISDNVDTQLGMRLAGIEGVVVHEEPEVRKALKQAMDTEDIAFTDYIFAVVTNAAELQTIFKETDSDLAITERFGIAYEFVRKKDGCFNASNHRKL